jgi:hypothetical protein
MYQLRESVSRSIFEPEPLGTLNLPPKTILFLIYVFRVFEEKYGTAAPSSLQHINDDMQLYVSYLKYTRCVK